MSDSPRQRLVIGWLIIGSMLSQCASDSDKTASDTAVTEPSSDDSDDEVDTSSRQVGSTFVNSLTNNSLTSWTVSKSKAEKLSQDLQSDAKGDDEKVKEALAALIATQRLAGQNLGSVLDTGRKLADVELKSGIGKEISESAKLEIALAAIQSRNYAMFDFIVEPLLTSKNAKIRAGAFNATGVVTLDEGRVPEAVQYFKNALKADPEYAPAMLNLGFVALQYGDTDTAKSMLGRVRQDWFTKSGKLVIARQTGDKGEANQLCGKLLPRNHKPTVFNCGLNEWISNNAPAKARDLINKALKLKGGPPSWDERGYEVLNQIRGG